MSSNNQFPDIDELDLPEIESGDYLAGGGGITEAMKDIPGLRCKFVLNHSSKAIKTNIFHHKDVIHYLADFYKQDEHQIPYVHFKWASIECTTHSKANGGADKKMGSYMMGFELVRYIDHGKPWMIGIENVPEFKRWGKLRIQEDVDLSTKKYCALKVDKKGKYKVKAIPGLETYYFDEWKKQICAMGYVYGEKIMNAADYGVPQRRKRYFCWFVKAELFDYGMEIEWPEQTHNKKGTHGFLKWEPCGPHIDLENEGESIFGRQFNSNIPRHLRRQLCPNSLKRLAGGVKRLHPDMYLIMQYYGKGLNMQKLTDPLAAVVCRDTHVLVKLEKMQFIQDFCHQDIYDRPEDPLSPQLTRQTKTLITLENKQHIESAYSRENTASKIDEPLPTITTGGKKSLLTLDFTLAKAQHLDASYGSKSGKYYTASPLSNPAGTIKTADGQHIVSVSIGKAQHLEDYYTRDNTASPLDTAAPAITCENSKHLLTLDFIVDQTFHDPTKAIKLDDPLTTQTSQQRHQFVKAQFVSLQNNSGDNPAANNHGIDEPSWSVTTTEKAQFISSYFNSSGHPETQNSGIDTAFPAILTEPNKQALITAIMNGEIDFDIKTRFLNPEELGALMTFPKGYFTNPKLKLSKKDAIKLIGNAVPPAWGRLIIAPMVQQLRRALARMNAKQQTA